MQLDYLQENIPPAGMMTNQEMEALLLKNEKLLLENEKLLKMNEDLTAKVVNLNQELHELKKTAKSQ